VDRESTPVSVEPSRRDDLNVEPSRCDSVSSALVNIVLLEPAEVPPNGVVRLADGRARHVIEVLRARVGDSLRVGVVDGPFGFATILEVAGGAVVFSFKLESAAPNRPRVDLLLAVPRPKVLRRLWSQLSALGVGRIILTNADKVERAYFDTHYLDAATYRPLLIEGLQQARDTRLPDVSIERRLKPFIEDDLDRLAGEGIRLVAEPAGEHAVGEAVGRGLCVDQRARVLLAVGPEGGWNEFELRLLAAHGFHAVSMGARTLRTDTACVALLTLVHAALSQSVS
jgi:16S rRNA (uracil1498-N3)-methyltransferase